VPADAARARIVLAASLSWGQERFPAQKSICISSAMLADPRMCSANSTTVQAAPQKDLQKPLIRA
jgi:hypothetical protein